jgi:hypothetical protein
MASIIRIKRSSVSGNPATLAAGELAYSALADNGSNGGDRLYIGMGTETAGNAVNHVIIGGRYYTSLVDAGGSGGSLNTTAKSIPVLSATGTIDKWLVGNLQLTGNTLSSTNTNGDINITPNGTGKTVLANVYIGDTATSLQEYIFDQVGGTITAGTGITSTVNDASNTTTLSITNTGVTAGSYGSATNIPVFTVNAQGQLTSASTVSVATNLNINGDTGSDAVSLLTDTLTFAGGVGSGISIAVTDNKVTVSGVNATTTSKGVASFDTNNFTVTAGAVSAKTITLGTSTLTLGSTTAGLAGLSSLGVTGNATIGGTLDVAGNLSVATNKFTVAAASGNTNIAGTLGVTGAGSFSSTLAVASNATVGGTLGVTGATTLSSTLNVTGNTTIGGTLLVSGIATYNANVDMNSNRIVNLAEPVADSDAATKYYVDAARSGLDIKNSVKAATTANITLSNTQTIDGVALSVGNRVLVKDQTNAAQNGIYIVASGSWTRAADADAPAELNPGTFVFVEQGTVNADTGFVVVSDSVLTIGTDAINWTLFSTSGTLIAGAGLSKNGYTLEVNTAAAGGLEIVSDNLQLKSSLAGDGLTYSAGVLNVVGTANRITANGDSIDIASTYVGQTSITTLGTITSGTWNGSVIADAYIADNLTISGGTINNTPIGATTRSSGAFTTLAANGAVTLSSTATVGDTLGVTGATTLSSTLAVSGNITAAANITGAGAGISTLDGFTIDGGTY